jgi:hypothetical protein
VKKSIVLLGIAGLLIALVGLLGALFLRQRQGELRQMEETLRDELAANRRQREAVRVARAKAAPAVPAVVAPAVPAAAKPARPATNLARGSRLADTLRSLPEYAPFEQRRFRRLNLRRYGELLAELKLAPAREEALKQIFDRGSVQGMQLFQDTYRQGGNQLSPEYSKGLQQQKAETDAAIGALLTADERAVYERYEKSSSWRTARQPELDEFVADRGLPPLTSAQKQALAAAACEVRNWKPDPAEGKLTNATMERRRNEQMAKVAAAALDPKQRQLLSDYLEFNQTRGEIAGRLFYPEKPAGSVFLTMYLTRP